MINKLRQYHGYRVFPTLVYVGALLGIEKISFLYWVVLISKVCNIAQCDSHSLLLLQKFE